MYKFRLMDVHDQAISLFLSAKIQINQLFHSLTHFEAMSKSETHRPKSIVLDEVTTFNVGHCRLWLTHNQH